jgi:hypothetical protein
MHAQDGMALIPDVTSAAPAEAVALLRRDALGLRATIASTLANLAPQAHPLRAPAVSPPVMNRWKMRNKTTIGMLLIRLAPISWFQ